MNAFAAGSLWPLAVALAGAGLIEFVCLRLLYRIGLFIPRGGPLFEAYRWATSLGSFAFDLASVLALLVVALAALAAARPHGMRAASLGALLGVALVVAVGPREWRDAAGAAFAGAALVAAAILTLPVLARRALDGFDRLALGAVTLAVVAGQSVAPASAAPVWLGLPGVDALWALRLAEGAAIAAAFALGAAALRAGPARRVDVAGALGLAALFGAALALQPYLTGIVALWATGVTLAFPAPLAVGAVAAFVFAAACELRRPARVTRGLAIVLLLVAGVVPQSSTHALVAIVAVGLLAGTIAPERGVVRGPHRIGERHAAAVATPALHDTGLTRSRPSVTVTS